MAEIEIDLEKERADLARFIARRDAGEDAPGAYEQMQAEGLEQVAAIRLLRGVYALTYQQALAVTGGGTPFKTPADTVRYLHDELGLCGCAGSGPVLFLRDVLAILHARIKAASAVDPGSPGPFQTRTEEFVQRVSLSGDGEAGGGAWLVMLLNQKNLLSHNRNLGDCLLTRKGEYLLTALETLTARADWEAALGGLGR